MTIITANKPCVLASALAAMLAAPLAHGELAIVPTATVRETWSDNPGLSSQGGSAQWITELSPGLRISDQTPRLQAALDYRLTAVDYSSDRPTGADRVTQYLNATLRARVVPDLIDLEADYRISLQPISAFGPVVQNDYTGNNRQEVRGYRISPSLRHAFGSFAVVQLRYTRDSVDAGGVGMNDSEGDALFLNVNSGAHFQKITWGLHASSQNVDTSALPATHNRSAGANLGYVVSRSLRLNLAGGYDKYTYDALSDKAQGGNWSTGLSWTPSGRTSLDASLGRRYYGDSYFLRLAHRSRATVWNISYSDDVTSTRSQFLIPSTVDTAALLDQMFMASYPDAAQRAAIVAAYMQVTGLPPSLPNSVNYFSNRYVLQKQLNAAVTWRGARSTAVLSVFRTRREALTNGTADSSLLGQSNFSLNDNVTQRGASAAFNYQLGAGTRLSLNALTQQSESLTLDLRTQSRIVAFTASRQFGRNLTGSLNLRRSHGSAGLNSSPYTENAVSAQLNFQL